MFATQISKEGKATFKMSPDIICNFCWLISFAKRSDRRETICSSFSIATCLLDKPTEFLRPVLKNLPNTWWAALFLDRFPKQIGFLESRVKKLYYYSSTGRIFALFGESSSTHSRHVASIVPTTFSAQLQPKKIAGINLSNSFWTNRNQLRFY